MVAATTTPEVRARSRRRPIQTQVLGAGSASARPVTRVSVRVLRSATMSATVRRSALRSRHMSMYMYMDMYMWHMMWHSTPHPLIVYLRWPRCYIFISRYLAYSYTTG